MVNPDTLSFLNPNSITDIAQNLLDLEVADDDIFLVADTKANTEQSY